MTVGIVSVITTIRSAGLSCSHETFCIDGVVGLQSNESVSGIPSCRTVSRRFSVQRQHFRAGTLDGVALISKSFLVQCLAETGLIGAVPVKHRRIKDLVVE